MSDWNNFNPFGSAREAFETMDLLNKARTADETTKTRQLLEEQVRLQREALELEKKKLAQEQEKIKLEREQLERQKRGQQPYTPISPLPKRTMAYSYGPVLTEGQHRDKSKLEALEAIRNQSDQACKLHMLQDYEQKYGKIGDVFRGYLGIEEN